MRDAEHSTSLQAYFFLVVTAACWGMNTIFGRLAVDAVSPMQLTMLRWFGVVILLLTFYRHQIAADWPILRQRLVYLALMGSCGFTLFNALFYLAAHSTTAINIGILQGSIPIFVLLGSLLFLGYRIRLIQAIGAVLTIVGVITIATAGNWMAIAQLDLNRGNLLMLIACFSYAAYSIGLSKRPQVGAISVFAVMALVAWIASLPLLAIEIGIQGFSMPTARGWIVAILVTLFPSFLAQVFFIKGVGLIGPGRAGVFINLVPVFASFLAVMILGEQFHGYHAMALLLVLGGVGLSELGKPKPV